jgi:Flp pilus assembly pilin Flp
MNRLANLTKRFINEQDGAVVTEYGLLIVVLVMGFIIALATFRTKIQDWFTNIGDNLNGLDSSSGGSGATASS